MNLMLKNSLDFEDDFPPLGLTQHWLERDKENEIKDLQHCCFYTHQFLVFWPGILFSYILPLSSMCSSIDIVHVVCVMCTCISSSHLLVISLAHPPGHTWYLSFFLHWQNFWRKNFTPKKRVNYDKIHSKLPIFCVITAKYTVNCQFFALNL